MIQAIEGKIVADLYLWTAEERKLESSYVSDYCYETICDVWRSYTQKRKNRFLYWFFFKIYITIIFQEISDVVSGLRFLPVTDLDPQATTWRKQSE